MLLRFCFTLFALCSCLESFVSLFLAIVTNNIMVKTRQSKAQASKAKHPLEDSSDDDDIPLIRLRSKTRATSNSIGSSLTFDFDHSHRRSRVVVAIHASLHSAFMATTQHTPRYVFCLSTDVV